MSYQTGQIVEGKVTGIQPYGAFVSLDKHTTGLIHISEISDGFIKDINQFVKIGDTVKVKIIDFDNKTNQARLSIKALNRSRVRNRRKQMPFIKASLPVMKLGFQSIASSMDQWIADAKGEILHDNEI